MEIQLDKLRVFLNDFVYKVNNMQTEFNKNFASGLLIPNSQRDIIQSVRILCNGNEIQEEKPTNFLAKVYPYRYTTGNANAEIPIYT